MTTKTLSKKQRGRPIKCKKCGKKIPALWRECEGCREARRARLKQQREEAALDREPTMEELDAMIAERMKDLPSWWGINSRERDVLQKPRGSNSHKKKYKRNGKQQVQF